VAKLTKAQAKQHAEACKILEKDVLTWDDKYFVLENWQESANHVNSSAGAFFTPPGLARDFAIEGEGRRIIDLCAGIGGLSFAIDNCWRYDQDHQPDITCVEINPNYIAVGKKILPHARWIQASVFDLPADIGHFDRAISNPPFGAIKHDGQAPRYTGKDFEYKVMDIASDIADFGAFIIPQMSAPFQYSGMRYYQERATEKHNRFMEQTKIRMEIGCSIDTAYYRDAWHGVAPLCEIVVIDFEEVRQARMEKSHRPKNPFVFAADRHEPPSTESTTQTNNKKQLTLF